MAAFQNISHFVRQQMNIPTVHHVAPNFMAGFTGGRPSREISVQNPIEQKAGAILSLVLLMGLFGAVQRLKKPIRPLSW